MTNDEHEEALQWRLNLLRVKLERGELQFAPELLEQTRRSLDAIRFCADGTIDLSTVDGRVRSLALVVAGSEQRKQVKDAISLEDISKIYFETIERLFGAIAKQASDLGLNAHQAARAVSTDPEGLVAFLGQIPKFLAWLEDFWGSVATSSDVHIQDITGLKAIYGGDLFPSHTRNIASSIGLYTETIVLSDPFWNTRHLLESAPDEQKVYFLIKHAVNVLKYRELATADLKQPVIVLTPFRSSIDDDEKDLLGKIMEVDGLKHASVMFGREFASAEDLWSFGEKLDSPEKVIAALVQPDRLLFDTEWNDPLAVQIDRALNSEWRDIGGEAHPGLLACGVAFSRMGQATDLLLKSRYLAGVPLIEAETSWQYFNWKLEYNAAQTHDAPTALHMIKGLQRVAETDETWLGSIPQDALIEMRQQGAFEEIRSVLSAGVSEIAELNPNAYFRSSDRIVDNIRDAFDAHSKEVLRLRSKNIRFAGHDVGSMLIAGGIDIASIITGTPTFGAASFAVNQLLDVPKLREIPSRFRELKDAHVALKRSPMGMLFKHR